MYASSEYGIENYTINTPLLNTVVKTARETLLFKYGPEHGYIILHNTMMKTERKTTF
jgi:hypothetical protein